MICTALASVTAALGATNQHDLEGIRDDAARWQTGRRGQRLSARPARRLPVKPRQPGGRSPSEVLAAKLTPEVRAFAAHLGRAVAESIIRDIRAGRWGTIERKPEEGRGEATDSERS